MPISKSAPWDLLLQLWQQAQHCKTARTRVSAQWGFEQWLALNPLPRKHLIRPQHGFTFRPFLISGIEPRCRWRRTPRCLEGCHIPPGPGCIPKNLHKLRLYPRKQVSHSAYSQGSKMLSVHAVRHEHCTFQLQALLRTNKQTSVCCFPR